MLGFRVFDFEIHLRRSSRPDPARLEIALRQFPRRTGYRCGVALISTSFWIGLDTFVPPYMNESEISPDVIRDGEITGQLQHDAKI